MIRRCFRQGDLMKMFLLALVAVPFCLGGCTSQSARPALVIMQDPATMEFVNCKVDKWSTIYGHTENEKCVEDLKKKGYIVWAER